MSQVRFELPTLVTLTAPTCAGKSFLLEALVEKLGFNRITSTTDRAPRAGEVDGLHYHFLTTEQSKAMEAADQFAELITYNGVRYGVTHVEMADKMATGVPPIVILEPQGLEIYKKYCASKGWQVFSIYVSTEEAVRLERLTERTYDDITDVLERPVINGGDIRKIIESNNKRMTAIFNQERGWISKNNWDLIVDGTNAERALADLTQAVASRNRRTAVYK